MGWVSYLEDILERLTDDLRSVDRVLDDPAITEAAKQNTLLEWHAKAQHVLLTINRNMDIATDPAVDLAAEVIDLERKKKELLAANAALAREKAQVSLDLATLHSQVANLTKTLATAKDALKVEKKRNAKLQDAIDADPAALYDKYSSPDRLKRLKKDDD